MNILQKSAEKTGKVMTESEIGSFLQGTLNLHLGTIDEKGEPNIQPVWFHHDTANQKIFFSTYADSKKMKNMQKNPIVYFSIDEDKFPYRCVKGKADVSISENISYNIPIVEKICLKQIGSLDDPISASVMTLPVFSADFCRIFINSLGHVLVIILFLFLKLFFGKDEN